LEDVRRLLRAGADKVSLNSAAVKEPGLLEEAARAFGSQCVVLAIDAKREGAGRGKGRGRAGGPDSEEGQPALCKALEMSVRQLLDWQGRMQRLLGPGGRRGGAQGPRWRVFIHGGRIDTGLDAVAWARAGVEAGAGEVLLTSMDADGTRDGYDLELTRAVAEAVDAPVIASGGAGKLEHLAEVLSEGKADAALAASIFHYGAYSLAEARELLAARGLPVRPWPQEEKGAEP
jgi:cyclase